MCTQLFQWQQRINGFVIIKSAPPQNVLSSGLLIFIWFAENYEVNQMLWIVSVVLFAVTHQWNVLILTIKNVQESCGLLSLKDLFPLYLARIQRIWKKGRDATTWRTSSLTSSRGFRSTTRSRTQTTNPRSSSAQQHSWNSYQEKKRLLRTF